MPHIGLLWNKLRGNYPNIQHAPPIGMTPEQILVDSATGLPLPRMWFINISDNQLIQFQFDRFYFNWRCRDDVYPRYPHVRDNFLQLLDIVEDWLKEQELGELKPLEYELSYINHIPKGEGWNTLSDLPSIFMDFLWNNAAGRFLPNPAKVAWTADFLLPEKKGHLIINFKETSRLDDKVPIFVLEVIARGDDGDSTSRNSMLAWYDLAHEWIVRGFSDLTTSEVQRTVWEREDV
jgi:uncharacterized protein (TIGR04255 family)